MVAEFARPLVLLLSILSLYRVFHAAFLTTATTVAERGHQALVRLGLAALIAVAGGLLFREHPSQSGIGRTLPVQIFCWATAGMAALFAASWYIETYCILYRDVRY